MILLFCGALADNDTERGGRVKRARGVAYWCEYGRAGWFDRHCGGDRMEMRHYSLQALSRWLPQQQCVSLCWRGRQKENMMKPSSATRKRISFSQKWRASQRNFKYHWWDILIDGQKPALQHSRLERGCCSNWHALKVDALGINEKIYTDDASEAKRKAIKIVAIALEDEEAVA